MLARADCAAVQWARQTTEDAIAMCPAGDRLAAEYALAAGIHCIQVLQDAPLPECEAVYVGTGGADRMGDVELARWAERMKATLLFDVLACSEPAQGVRQVTCDAGRGARFVLHVRGPIIAVLSLHVARPAYVSRFRRGAAGRQLSGTLSNAYDQVGRENRALAWQPVRPRVRAVRGPQEASTADQRLDGAFSIQAGGGKQETHVIVADAETCARHLLRYLAHYALLPDSVWVPAERPAAPEVLRAAMETESSETQRPPSRSVSSCEWTDRRPRLQAGASREALARQPRPLGETARPVSATAPREPSQRRPRQTHDSPARLARQPRPIGGPQRRNDV